MHEEPDVDAKSAKAFASFAFPPLRPLRWNSSLRSPPTARRGSPAPPRHVASECGPVREGRYFDLWAFPLFFICIFDYVKMPDADFTSERSEVKSCTSEIQRANGFMVGTWSKLRGTHLFPFLLPSSSLFAADLLLCRPKGVYVFFVVKQILESSHKCLNPRMTSLPP